MNEESVCYKCRHFCVAAPGEPETRDSPAIPADLECEIGNDENFGTRWGCWDWTPREGE